MSKNFAIYNTTTGEITKTLVAGDNYTITDVLLNAASGENAMLVSSGVVPSTHYINVSGTPTETAKVSLDTICSYTNSGGTWSADGVDTIVYGSSLPNPTNYVIQFADQPLNNLTGQITDGTFTLTTSIKGDYVINLSAFPYLNKTITTTAV
jgi:hypothetical protein